MHGQGRHMVTWIEPDRLYGHPGFMLINDRISWVNAWENHDVRQMLRYSSVDWAHSGSWCRVASAASTQPSYSSLRVPFVAQEKALNSSLSRNIVPSVSKHIKRLLILARLPRSGVPIVPITPYHHFINTIVVEM